MNCRLLSVTISATIPVTISVLTALLAGCGVRDNAGAAGAPVYNVPVMVVSHLYVAPTGQDTNAGTQEKPFATIARAAEAATPGTIVHVAPGTYEGGFKTLTSGSVTPGGRITYQSTERWRAIIVPAEPARATSAVAWDNRGNYVDIAGFDIDGRHHQGGIKWTTGIYSGGSHDAIKNNHVHHIATDVPCTSAGGSGIGVDSYYRGVHSDVIGNSVHDIGPAGCRFIQGIYMNTPGTVRNNIVYRVAEAGIHLWHDANNVIIANNTVTASNTGIVVGGGDFYYTKGPNDHTYVFNNIVYDNRMGIFEQGATGKNNRYRNNLVFQNRDADWKLSNGLAHQDTVAQAPAFVGYSRHGTPDFRLAANSPAIGKGLAGQPDTVDFHGKPRTAQTGIDLGALQH
jgi:parallel beta-helix repeat protein